MGLPITTSADISNFDYSVNYNYHTRQVTINDLSTYIGGGAGLVQGINFLITSPSGIVLSNNTSYAPADIEPSAPLPFVKNLAFFNGGIEPGTYTIVGTIKDAAGLTFSLTKTTNLCRPKQCPPLSAFNGCVNVSWRVFCADNKIIVADNTEFSITVNGIAYQGTPTYDITLINPNNVVLAQNVTSPYFEISPVVNGTYSLSIDDSAIYDVGDNVTVTVHYVLENAKKEAQCNINLCDVYCAVNEMYESWTALKGNGSNTEKTLKSKLDQLALLIGLTQVAINCGNDVTDLLTQIEKLSGAKCSCECGTQTVNSGAGIAPDQTIVFQTNGGDITVSQQTVGLTTTFTVSDKTYVVALGGGITPDFLTVTSSTVGDTTTFTLTVTPITWTNLTPAAGWTIVNRLQYGKDGYGNVYVRGDLSGDPALGNNTIGTLPVGYRPSAASVFPVSFGQTSDSTNKLGIVTISTVGVMVLYLEANYGAGIIGTNFVFNVN